MVGLLLCGVVDVSSVGQYYDVHCSVMTLYSLHSRFLGNIKAAYDKNPNLVNLLLDDFFKEAIDKCQVGIV